MPSNDLASLRRVSKSGGETPCLPRIIVRRTKISTSQPGPWYGSANAHGQRAHSPGGQKIHLLLSTLTPLGRFQHQEHGPWQLSHLERSALNCFFFAGVSSSSTARLP